MPDVRELIAEVKAAARGEAPMVKQASAGSARASLSPAQLLTLADRIEKAGHVQDASAKIVEMRKAASVAPELTEVELKKLAYRQALRELGFKGATLSPLNLLFGNMTEAQSALAKFAADATTTLMSHAVQLGLSNDEEAPSE